MGLLNIGEPAPSRAGAAPSALWALGFRPFYLLAAAFACLAIPLWVLNLGGVVPLPLPGVLWHAHEMIFGFAVAVIVGFLFTAGRNWTGLPTPSGASLAMLAALWLAGRVSLLLSQGALAALIDFLFLPMAAFALGRVLVRAGNRRNYFILVMLGTLATANGVFHLARLQLLSVTPLTALHFSLGLIVLLETVIGGRVIPMFTENGVRMATGQSVLLMQSTWLNRAAIAATGLALLLWVLGAGAGLGALAAAISLLAAGLQWLRSLRWKPWLTVKVPLLWILHVGHLWIPVGLLLLVAVQIGWLPASAAVHAFGIGATGGLIIGMITRTALGHTGRLLVAGRLETAAYVLITGAALARVLTVVVLPPGAVGGIHLTAGLWVLGFALYLYRYMPFLTRPRADGRPE